MKQIWVIILEATPHHQGDWQEESCKYAPFIRHGATKISIPKRMSTIKTMGIPLHLIPTDNTDFMIC